MGCNNYSYKQFRFVESRRKQSTLDEFVNFLEAFYTDEDSKEILNAVTNGAWSEEFKKPLNFANDANLIIKSLDDDGFLMEKPTTSDLRSLYQDPIYGGSIAMANVINEFEEDIVERLIYDKKNKKGIDSSIVLPNGHSIINQKLFEYKKDLLNRIWSVTKIDRSDNFNSDFSLTKSINDTLKDFEYLLMSRNDEYLNAYKDYVKLKAFDTLIKNLDFISIKSAYNDGRFIGINMYDYVGPQMKRDASFGKESAEISDYTGSIVKLLLKNCFTRINKLSDGSKKEGGYITEVSFNRAMTRLFEWYMYDNGRFEDPENYKKLLNKDSSINYADLIDTYLNKNNSKSVYQTIINSILRGAQDQIFNKNSGLTAYIKGCFDRHVTDVFSQVYLQYGLNQESKTIENKETTDYFVELQSNNIQNILKIQAEIWRPHLKRKSNTSSIFTQILDEHEIKIDSTKKEISIHGDEYVLEEHNVENNTSGFVYKVKLKNERLFTNITDEQAIELIRDILGIEIVSNYKEIIEGIAPGRSLMSLFDQAIVLTLAAASNGFNFIKYNKSDLINTYYYRSALLPIAEYLSEVYGEDTINVIKNQEGNALPLYSLGSLSKKIHRVLNTIKDSSVAQYNPFVTFPELLMREYVRSQVDINGTIKASKQLGPSEIMSVQMLNDFWYNLNRDQLNPTVKMMPITLSDKSTHALYGMNLNKYRIQGQGLGEMLKIIGLEYNSSKANKLKQDILNDFSERESLKIKQQLIHIISKYSEVYNFEFDKENAIRDVLYLKQNIDRVNEILKSKKNIDEVKKDFKNIRFIDILYCDLNYLGELSINPQLLFDAELHLFKTESFDDIIRQNKIDFISDMRSNRFKINGNIYKNIPTLKTSKYGQYWYDDVSQSIEPFLIFDENGKIISDHTVDIDWNKCTFEIHPVLESYFYANMLLNVPLQEIMLGSTYTYKSRPSFRNNKQNVINDLNNAKKIIGTSLNDLSLNSSFKEIYDREIQLLKDASIIMNSNEVKKKIELSKLLDDDQFKIHDLLKVENDIPLYDRLDKIGFYKQTMSLKLNDKMKRALIVGSTITSPIFDRAYCAPKKCNVAICKDFYGFAFNLSGDTNNKEPHDGGGWVSPFFSRAVNFGLYDASVGSNKKTIAGELDPETLVFREIKWAEFELSNQYRKRTFDESEYSAEIMFKKMHDKQIPIAELNSLFISRFYGKRQYKSKFYDTNITHLDDIYFFDPADGNYYKILDVSSNKNVCTRLVIKTDKNGNEIGKPISQPLSMNSIYDLDQIFGGCFCKKLSDDGVLIDSNVNSDIVYKIISEHELQDYIIHIIANTSSFKTGIENVNNPTTSSLSKYNNLRTSIFNKDDATHLKTIKFDLSNYGAIMDADHELDSDTSVKEMGQVISALIQEGASIDVVDQIYNKIGELAYSSMSDFIEAHRQFENGNNTKLIKALGKAVVEAFRTRNQGNIALAYSFLDSFEKNTNMPFSSHAVSGVALSSIGSKLTKLSLKTTYSGLGTVQVPSNGIIKYYDYGGKRYDYEGLVSALKRSNISINDIYDVGEFNESISILEDGTSIIQLIPTNKTLKSINKLTEIDFEDTIVIYNSITKQSEVIKISDVSSRDYYRNRYDWSNKFGYKWTSKSKDLLPQVTRFTYNGENYTAWDLSSYRAMAYAKSLLDSKSFSKEDLEYMKQWLLIYNPNLNLDTDLESFVENQKKLFKNDLNRLSDIQNGKFTTLENDPIFIDPITNVKTDAGQIVLGKRFMKQFGLRRGDNLADINNHFFFYDRIRQQYKLPDDKEVSKEFYDAVLYTKNGEKILVILSDLDDTKLSGTTVYTGNVLSNRGDSIWYKDEEEINISKNSNIRSKVINGKEHIVLSVKSLDDLETIRNCSFTSLVRFNHNQRNVKTLAPYELEFNWRDSSDLIHFDKNVLKVFGIDSQDITVENLSKFSEEDLISLLNAIELNRLNNVWTTLSKARFQAFKKSLNAIGTRIPAQSMQSFMSLEIVGFTESEVNDIYVPYTLTWVAGSDYDIDKVYVMQYSIADDGSIYTNTCLRQFNVDDQLKFPFPKGRRFENRTKGYAIDANTAELILNNNIQPMLNILNQDLTNLSFDENIEPWKVKRILNLLNRHERFKMSEKHKQESLKNFILNNMIKVIQDPKNQINVLTPVHTRKIKAGAKGSELGERETHLSLLTPTTTMIMQDQNMLGKTSIASSATGEKVYFHVLNHYSSKIKDLENLILNPEVDEQTKFNSIISELENLVIKSPIYNEFDQELYLYGGDPKLSLIGNSSLKPIVSAIENAELSNIAKALPKLEFGIFKDRFINSDGKTFNLIALINSLHSNSNKTNCSEDMSEVITTSTDNAKELDLKKINAIPETLDVFTYLISIGTDLSDVLKFTKNPAFKICVDFAKSSIFIPGVSQWASFDNVVKFVRNQESLQGPAQYAFKQEIIGTKEFWGDFLQENLDSNTYNTIITALNRFGIKQDRYKYDDTYFPKFMSMFEINIPNVNLEELFLKYIKNKIVVAKNSFNIPGEVEDLINQLNSEGDDIQIPTTQDNLNTLRKYIDVYNYFKYTFIPKNHSIKKILNDVKKSVNDTWDDYITKFIFAYNERINKPLYILENNILPGVKEQKILGFIFGINKGLATSDVNEYQWVAKVNQRINELIYNYSEKTKRYDLQAFDLIEFIKNEEYRNNQINQIENIKHTYNVLKVMVDASHTWNRIKSISVLRDTVSTIGFFDFERKLVKQVLHQDLGSITKNHTYRVMPNEWTNVRNYTRNVFIWNWFNRQENLKFDMFEGQLGFNSKNNTEPVTFSHDKQCSLNNEIDLATFKWLFETDFITWLKRQEKYKDNQFVQKLIKGGVTDLSGNLISYVKFSFGLHNADKNSTYTTMYSQILNNFNKIMFDEVKLDNFKNYNWTIGDLFFVYNLYVNKEAAGSDSMLKLFEDNVLYGNQLKTAKSYYDYLSAIDKWGISFNSNDPNKIELEYHPNDLVYYMRFVGEHRSNVYGTSKLTPDQVLIKSNVTPEFTKSSGYFLFNFPYLLNSNYKTKALKAPVTIDVKDLRSNYSANLENESTIRAIVDNMTKVLSANSNVPIKVVDSIEIKRIFAEKNYSDLSNQAGFIKNGIIYINLDNATLDTPIHELSHLICAGMKFSVNSSVRDTYYKLLKTVEDNQDAFEVLQDFDRNLYDNKHLSDLREELLVRILSAHLKNAFEIAWPNIFNKKELTPNDLTSAITKTLNTILKITDAPDNAGQFTLEAILKSFNSKLFDLSGGWLSSGIVIKSQRVATIKDRLIKNNDLNIEGNC